MAFLGLPLSDFFEKKKIIIFQDNIFPDFLIWEAGERIPYYKLSYCCDALWSHVPHPFDLVLGFPSITESSLLSLRVIWVFSSVRSLSCVWLFVTPWTAAYQAFLSITNSQSLLKLMSIELVMPSNHLILCHLLLLLPSVFPSIRVFSNESVLRIRWPKNWSFSFSNSPSNEYSGLISFRLEWLDLLAVQGTLKSLLQHHISKASIPWYSAFFILSVTIINFTITGMITKMKCSLFPKFSLCLGCDNNHFIIPESGFPIQIQWFLSLSKPVIMPHSGV